ncbi:carbohydrate kinase family protein [Pedobacter cryophilus]|uniref:Carbohydrate kinase n=1 Tax=Pedobacter cryophilus TaxID=2571271 RepID=A0A4U1BWP1_9SPHI|nr:carbohydrate kinase [Pedobacter cryophilus]TKB95520.1 carbohydrate kinase [Pedobacter cryophilus]
MLKNKIVTIGEILFDVFENTKKPGGSSLNVSLHLQKQGIPVGFISAVGDDQNGEELLSYLKDQNFDTSHIQTSSLPTSTVTVQLDKNKQASYIINKPVAWDDIALNNDLIELVKAADAFVYCSLTCRELKSKNTIYQLLEYAQLKVFDINLRPPFYEIETLKYLLAKVDILKINEDELRYLTNELSLPTLENEALKVLSKEFKLQLICLTLGDKGAKVYYKNEIYSHSGYQVNVVDTVGAGDAFLATFINYYLKGINMNQILEIASKIGSFVASQAGANPKYPENLLNKYPN